MDLTQNMTSLYRAGLLDEVFYTYLTLRSLSSAASISFTSGSVNYTSSYDEVDRFIIACELAQKKLVEISPFPVLSISLRNHATISKDEVLRSGDTVGKTTYIFNAIQATQGIVELDSAFLTKWNITIADLIAALPRILKLTNRLNQVHVEPAITLVWTSIATHNPSSISPNELHSLYSLGLSKTAYVFWILQEEAKPSPCEIDLLAVSQEWQIDSVDCLSALSSLSEANILTYEIDAITISWAKTLSNLPTHEIDFTGELMKPEGKMMYQLWRDQERGGIINPVTFCANNAIAKKDFYNFLKRIRKKQILNYSFKSVHLTWARFYEPRSTPEPQLILTRTPTPTPTPEPESTPAPTPTPTPEPQSILTRTPTPEPQPTPAPTPTPEPQSTPAPTPTPEPQSTLTPTPTPEPQSTLTPTPTPEPQSIPAATPTPTPGPQTIIDSRYSSSPATEQPASEMTVIYSGYISDGCLVIPNVGFDFPFDGTSFREIYLCTNSYITFGYQSSSVVHIDDEPKPKHGLYIAPGSRSIGKVYISRPSQDSLRIRYSGRQRHEPTFPINLIWQVTLFTNGVIEVLPISYPDNGECELRITSDKYIRIPSLSQSVVFYPQGTDYIYAEGSYT